MQQLQNCLISWLFNWFKMPVVFVMFLGCKCFIQPLFSSDCSIDLCFDDMLEQQGVGLKKLQMVINPKCFNWMVFVISIFQLLAGSRRNKHECAWPNEISTPMGSLISQDSLWSSFISCYMCHHRPNTRDLTLLLALMKFRAWSANFVAWILAF